MDTVPYTTLVAICESFKTLMGLPGAWTQRSLEPVSSCTVNSTKHGHVSEIAFVKWYAYLLHRVLCLSDTESIAVNRKYAQQTTASRTALSSPRTVKPIPAEVWAGFPMLPALSSATRCENTYLSRKQVPTTLKRLACISRPLGRRGTETRRCWRRLSGPPWATET